MWKTEENTYYQHVLLFVLSIQDGKTQNCVVKVYFSCQIKTDGREVQTVGGCIT